MKPQDLLLGVRDFFAVLIPGAVLLFVLTVLAAWPAMWPRWLARMVEQAEKPLPAVTLTDTEEAFVFAVAAYAVGQFVAAVSTVLDKPVDWVERNSGKPLPGGRLLPPRNPRMRLWRFRCLATVLKDHATAVLLSSKASKDDAGRRGDLDFRDRSNDLWSVRSFWRDYLHINKPEATAELDRIESAQKMFRSFCIVVLVVALLVAPKLSAVQLAGAAAIFLLCYALFARFRLLFFYRLYKLALLTTLPEDHVEKTAGPFFRTIPELLKEIETRGSKRRD